jgi:Glycosyl transferase family 2
MQETEPIDVVVRFHDVRRLAELDRAVFSLVTQRYRPMHVLLAVQRFAAEEIASTRAALAPLLSIDDAPTVTILNWDQREPQDARSALINLGIQAARGRYLAFLDYDDVLYPEAYEMLICRLRKTGAAIAFGGISVRDVQVFDAYLRTMNRTFPFSGTGLLDLFSGNFCPIHSFVIDRSRIAVQHLFFEPLMTKNEDYDFLIRVCAQYPADFSLVKTYIGAYNTKTDGSNTILTESSSTATRFGSWRDAESFIEGRRRTTPVSAAVQRTIGLKPVPEITVHGLLARERPNRPHSALS